MLNYYFVIHSTVTFFILLRLLSTNQLKIIKMKTLNNNQILGNVETSKSSTWNSKRRFRSLF